MRAALVSVSVVVDVEDFDELSKLVASMETSAAKGFRDALASGGATFDDISEMFEFYGVSASPIRDTLDAAA